MHVLQNEHYLRHIKLNHRWLQSAKRLEHVEQLPVSHIVHQNEQIATVLGDASHFAQKLVVHLGHVLNLIEQMLLLLRLKHFALGDYLDGVDGPVVPLGRH